MQRRQFIGSTLNMAAFTSLAGCVSRPTGEETNTAKRVRPTDAKAFAAERRFAALSGGRIAYVDRGSGPAALFLHGFPLNSFQWRGQLDRLSSHRRCIAPDFMGLGFTEVAPGQSVVPAAQVEMLGELLDTLGVASVDLVANDSGGAVAQLFVLRYPQRVRTMLLTNCDVEPDSPPPALQPVLDMARAGTFADSWLAPWVADKRLARSDQGLGGMTFTFPINPTDEAIDYYLAPLVSSAERKALTHAYALGLDPNPLAGIASALNKCPVPTRILWGTGDTIFSRESPGYLDRLLPSSRGVRLVEGAKLFFPEEYPDLIAEEARKLWGA
jgi:haloalkane dehalogenase